MAVGLLIGAVGPPCRFRRRVRQHPRVPRVHRPTTARMDRSIHRHAGRGPAMSRPYLRPMAGVGIWGGSKEGRPRYRVLARQASCTGRSVAHSRAGGSRRGPGPALQFGVLPGTMRACVPDPGGRRSASLRGGSLQGSVAGGRVQLRPGHRNRHAGDGFRSVGRSACRRASSLMVPVRERPAVDCRGRCPGAWG